MVSSSSAAASRAHKAQHKYGVCIDFPNLNLHAAAASGNLGLVEYALAHGQPVNSVLDGVQPIHAASAGGSEVVVRALIENGADVRAPRLPRRYTNVRKTTDPSSSSSHPHSHPHIPSPSFPSFHHHRHDHHHAPSSPPPSSNSTPHSPHTTSSTAAAHAGGTVAAAGSTPLHYAAANGHTGVLRILLAHGAKPRPDKHGVTPGMLAERGGWTACVAVLREWEEAMVEYRSAGAAGFGGGGATIGSGGGVEWSGEGVTPVDVSEDEEDRQHLEAQRERALSLPGPDAGAQSAKSKKGSFDGLFHVHVPTALNTHAHGSTGTHKRERTHHHPPSASPDPAKFVSARTSSPHRVVARVPSLPQLQSESESSTSAAHSSSTYLPVSTKKAGSSARRPQSAGTGGAERSAGYHARLGTVPSGAGTGAGAFADRNASSVGRSGSSSMITSSTGVAPIHSPMSMSGSASASSWTVDSAGSSGAGGEKKVHGKYSLLNLFRSTKSTSPSPTMSTPASASATTLASPVTTSPNTTAIVDSPIHTSPPTSRMVSGLPPSESPHRSNVGLPNASPSAPRGFGTPGPAVPRSASLSPTARRARLASEADLPSPPPNTNANAPLVPPPANAGATNALGLGLHGPSPLTLTIDVHAASPQLDVDTSHTAARFIGMGEPQSAVELHHALARRSTEDVRLRDGQVQYDSSDDDDEGGREGMGARAGDEGRAGGRQIMDPRTLHREIERTSMERDRDRASPIHRARGMSTSASIPIPGTPSSASASASATSTPPSAVLTPNSALVSLSPPPPRPPHVPNLRGSPRAGQDAGGGTGGVGASPARSSRGLRFDSTSSHGGRARSTSATRAGGHSAMLSSGSEASVTAHAGVSAGYGSRSAHRPGSAGNSPATTNHTASPSPTTADIADSQYPYDRPTHSHSSSPSPNPHVLNASTASFSSSPSTLPRRRPPAVTHTSGSGSSLNAGGRTRGSSFTSGAPSVSGGSGLSPIFSPDASKGADVGEYPFGGGERVSAVGVPTLGLNEGGDVHGDDCGRVKVDGDGNRDRGDSTSSANTNATTHSASTVETVERNSSVSTLATSTSPVSVVGAQEDLFSGGKALVPPSHSTSGSSTSLNIARTPFTRSPPPSNPPLPNANLGAMARDASDLSLNSLDYSDDMDDDDLDAFDLRNGAAAVARRARARGSSGGSRSGLGLGGLGSGAGSSSLGIDLSAISSHAQAEALVQQAQARILAMADTSSSESDVLELDEDRDTGSPGTARLQSRGEGLDVDVDGGSGGGSSRPSPVREKEREREREGGWEKDDGVPLSAKLAAYGASLAIERRFKRGEAQRVAWAKEGSSDDDGALDPPISPTVATARRGRRTSATGSGSGSRGVSVSQTRSRSGSGAAEAKPVFAAKHLQRELERKASSELIGKVAKAPNMRRPQSSGESGRPPPPLMAPPRRSFGGDRPYRSLYPTPPALAASRSGSGARSISGGSGIRPVYGNTVSADRPNFDRHGSSDRSVKRYYDTSAVDDEYDDEGARGLPPRDRAQTPDPSPFGQYPTSRAPAALGFSTANPHTVGVPLTRVSTAPTTLDSTSSSSFLNLRSARAAAANEEDRQQASAAKLAKMGLSGGLGDQWAISGPAPVGMTTAEGAGRKEGKRERLKSMIQSIRGK